MLAAKSDVQVDVPEVRVTEWRLAPGSATGHHTHGMDYVIVPVTSGEMTIVATNGETYDGDRLKEAVKAAAKPGAGPIELLVKTGERYRTVKLDYHGGLRYPKLEKVGAAPAALDAILAARD